MLALLSYQLILLLLFPIVLLLLFFRSFSQKAYRQRLSERFGLIDKSFVTGGIVIHGASVGEVLALRPFIEQALIKWPSLPITVTTFTPTGSEQVKKLFGDKVQHCYLPIDMSLCVRAFLKRLQPQAIVFMETELWPSLISQAHSRGIKLQLINARLSQKSMKQYAKISSLIVPSLAKFGCILAQSQDNAEHYLKLGAPSDKVMVSGNLKYDLTADSKVAELTLLLKSQVEGERFVVVAGSTHQGDDELVLASYKALKVSHPELLLVIVPRHPERFNKVAELITEQGLLLARRQNEEKVLQSTDIWLIDTLGELLAVYAFADICVIGGSFSDIGGHNPLEAALFAKPILSGPDMANFKEMNGLLNQANAQLQLKTNDQLTEKLAMLIEQEELRHTLGQAGLQVVKDNQGATQLSIEKLDSLLN